MTAALAGYIFSAVCYGLSTGHGIRFDAKRTVAIAAALAPAVVSVGLRLPDTTNPWLLGVGPLIAVVTLAALRRPVQEMLGHVTLFGAAVATFALLAEAASVEPLVAGMVAGGFYLAGDAARQIIMTSSQMIVGRSDLRTFWLLHAVLLCACGLTVLGVQEMDWPAFVAMAVVLALTKREFEAFAKARTTYDQTVQALDELKRREQHA